MSNRGVISGHRFFLQGERHSALFICLLWFFSYEVTDLVLILVNQFKVPAVWSLTDGEMQE